MIIFLKVVFFLLLSALAFGIMGWVLWKQDKKMFDQLDREDKAKRYDG